MNPYKSKQALLPVERIEQSILMIRRQKVMLDRDLAQLYGVETGALNRAVSRNIDRFPPDFMFHLTPEEAQSLRCQIGTSSSAYGGRRYLPYVFTEQGVAMPRLSPNPHRMSPSPASLSKGQRVEFLARNP